MMEMDMAIGSMTMENLTNPVNFTEQEVGLVTRNRETDSGIATSVCLGVIGCISNGLVIIVFCSSKKLRSSVVNIYLINQSCLDLAASLMLITMATAIIGVSGLAADSLKGKYVSCFLLCLLG